MRAARILSPSSPIYPLDEPASDLLVGARPLRLMQQEEAGDVVDIAEGEPFPPDVDVAFTADAVFSRETIAALRRVKRGRAAIRAGTPLWRAATRLVDANGDLPLPLFCFPPGSNPDLSSLPLVAVCDEDGAERVRVPPHGRAPHVIEIPSVTRLGGRIGHWLEALEMSLAALRTDLLLRTNPLGARPHERAEIHPTAYISRSILEAGVKVEAHASIIDSYVGRGAHIADHSVIHSCVIGEGCRTLVDTSLRRVVAMPGSTLSNLSLTDSIIGRRVFLTTAVATFGPPPGCDAVVDGKDTRRALVGAAIGARAILGARALLQAGVALPAGVLVVAKPEEAASRFDDAGLARASMIRGRADENV